MKNVHIGMFIEINKNRLSSTNMTRAVSALESSSDDKVYSLLYRKTKNPSVTSFLALFFGWLGLDRFYLGDVLGGITRIVLTALCVALGCFCHFFVDLVGGVLEGDLLNYMGYIQALIAIITASFYPIYVSFLVRQAIVQAPRDTKKKNAEIFNLECKEYKWSIK